MLHQGLVDWMRQRWCSSSWLLSVSKLLIHHRGHVCRVTKVHALRIGAVCRHLSHLAVWHYRHVLGNHHLRHLRIHHLGVHWVHIHWGLLVLECLCGARWLGMRGLVLIILKQSCLSGAILFTKRSFLFIFLRSFNLRFRDIYGCCLSLLLHSG